MNGVIFVLLAIVCIALYGGLVWVVRRAIKPSVHEGHNDVLVPLFLTAGTLYAVLLAFLVIAVWEAHDAANANAAEEASTLATMYRMTAGMPPDEQRTLRAEIREYTEAVVKQEWAIQAASGGASPAARHMIAEIYRTIGSLPPREAALPITQEFLRTYSTVAADRNRRTLQANESLPAILWIVLLVGAGIVLTMTLFLYMDAFWFHFIVGSLCGSLIVILLFMTFVMNQPFRGSLALEPGAFEHSLGVYDSVDKGN